MNGHVLSMDLWANDVASWETLQQTKASGSVQIWGKFILVRQFWFHVWMPLHQVSPNENFNRHDLYIAH